MEYEAILYEVSDNIATITLNRPTRMNVMGGSMRFEVVDAFDRADADDNVRAVILTGAGKAFCAGADLSRGNDIFDKSTKPDNPRRPDGSFDYAKASARDGGGVLALRMYNSLKPVIAAINGVAVGVGASMTLPADIRIVSEDARMGFVYAKFGIVYDCCSSYFLPRAVGLNKALEWSMTARIMNVPELAAAGLFNHVVPADQVVAKAREIAGQIAGNVAPVSVALMRHMVWQGQAMRHPMDAHRLESWGITNRGQSADAREGGAAFAEKRAPQFPGKVSSDMPDFFPWWDEPGYSGPPF